MQNSKKFLQISIHHQSITLHCDGIWPMAISKDMEKFYQQIATAGNIQKIIIDASKLKKVSSPFLIFLKKLKSCAQKNGLILETKNVPESVQKIFKLAESSEFIPAKNTIPPNFIYRIGTFTLSFYSSLKKSLAFFLTLMSALNHVLWHGFKHLWINILPFVQQTGIEALPIVILISALVGLILAFVSVAELERFGASIYVADLVGLAMTREMGSLMTGVIMAGRTGAAFAASIGSMQVNEELDALQTFGIDKMTYLVLPRVIALAWMMPILCIFSDLIGIMGGMISALPFMDCSMVQYLNQLKCAVKINDVVIGLLKSFCFGVIIAGIGCYKGIQCGRNASAVGNATTSAVVQGITWIIIADAIFSVLCTALGI